MNKNSPECWDFIPLSESNIFFFWNTFRQDVRWVKRLSFQCLLYHIFFFFLTIFFSEFYKIGTLLTFWCLRLFSFQTLLNSKTFEYKIFKICTCITYIFVMSILEYLKYNMHTKTGIRPKYTSVHISSLQILHWYFVKVECCNHFFNRHYKYFF